MAGFGTRTNSDSPDAGGPPGGSQGTPASSGQFPMLLPSLASLPNTPSAQARLLPLAYGTVKAAAYLIEASPPAVRQPGPFSGVAGSAPIGSVINSDGSAWKCIKGGFAVNGPTGQGADPAARIALHAYNTFDVVTNSGNVYQAIKNGTTDATGGPTGTGTSITDGTTAWQYLGTTPYPVVVTADGLIWRYLQQLPYPLYIQLFLGALCEGEITGAVSFFVDKERYSAPGATDLGQLTLLKGVDAVNQVPGYGDSMGYQHTALIAPTSPNIAGGVPTGTQKEIPAYAVEINGVMFGAATPDVSPADVVNDLLTHTRRGCSWPSSRVGATVTGTGVGDFRVYCDATGARFSMYIDSQRSALSLLSDILNATNCDALWSQGALKIVPLGDQPIASPVYGATGYVPNNTAQYNLSETDFLDPIQITRAPDSDCYNSFPIEFVDRSTVYQRNTVEDPDQTDIDSKGMIWRAATVSLPLVFPDGTYPIMLSRIYAQRSLYVRNTYTFKLPWRYLLLEPTDIVTLSDATMGLSLVPVRIISMREGADFTWEVVAEEYPAGVAASGAYTPQAGDGYKPNAAGTAAAGIPTAFGTGALTSPGLDNVWPNPTSEISPPTGYTVANDGNQPEFDYRVNVGAGAYSGNWVRQLDNSAGGSPVSFGFTVSALAGDRWLAQARVKAPLGNGWVRLRFFDGAGAEIEHWDSLTQSANAWGLFNSFKSFGKYIIAPANTVKARAELWANLTSTIQFDEVVFRRLSPNEQLSDTVTYNSAATLTVSANAGGLHIMSVPAGGTTVAAPLNGFVGQRITIKLRNTTGGALPATVWNAVFKMAAWVDPANTFNRTSDFIYDGTNWVQVGPESGDVPN